MQTARVPSSAAARAGCVWLLRCVPLLLCLPPPVVLCDLCKLLASAWPGCCCVRLRSVFMLRHGIALLLLRHCISALLHWCLALLLPRWVLPVAAVPPLLLMPLHRFTDFANSLCSCVLAGLSRSFHRWPTRTPLLLQRWSPVRCPLPALRNARTCASHVQRRPPPDHCRPSPQPELSFRSHVSPHLVSSRRSAA